MNPDAVFAAMIVRLGGRLDSAPDFTRAEYHRAARFVATCRMQVNDGTGWKRA
jgi:hypothetical protein